MSTETTNKKIKIDNGTTFGRTYTDKAVDERLQGLVSTATFTPVKEKANNSLQKPAGLTKTELVGVGANGQESIEIGNNLTLANGKLSATGDGSGGVENNILTGTITKFSDEEIGGTYTGTIELNKINKLLLPEFGDMYIQLTLITTQQDITGYAAVIAGLDWYVLIVNSGMFSLTPIPINKYSHFVTLTNNNDKIYLQYYNINENSLNMDSLKTALSGKKVLCTGHLGNSDETKADPKFVSGEAGGLEVHYVLQNDTSGTITSKSITSFTISDLVTPVE